MTAYSKDGVLKCDRCGTSVMSRALRTMAIDERLCSQCIRCEYFVDSEHAQCPNPPAAFVQPKPVGDFQPALLCIKHVFPWTRDMANLGADWSIVAVSVEAARALGSLA